MGNKIFIGIPNYGGVKALTFGTIVQAIGSIGCNIQLSLYPDCALIAFARSELLGRFLRSDCSHMLFIDCDISFDPSLINRMLGTNKDVITAVYSSRHPPYDVKINKSESSKIIKVNRERLIEIHSTGLGCTLISRRAVEETCKFFPELEYFSDGGSKSYALFLEAVRPAPPDNIPKFMGEDIMFYWRLRDAGFPAYAMVDAVVKHDNRDFCLADILDKKKRNKKSK